MVQFKLYSVYIPGIQIQDKYLVFEFLEYRRNQYDSSGTLRNKKGKYLGYFVTIFGRKSTIVPFISFFLGMFFLFFYLCIFIQGR